MECQRRVCLYNDIEGDEQKKVPLLRDVFIPLKLTQSGLVGGPMGSHHIETMNEFAPQFLGRYDLTIWDLLKEVRRRLTYSRLIIQANGGFGKTTLLRHITYTYTHKGFEKAEKLEGVPRLIPVLIYLRKWQGLIAPEDRQTLGPDLPTLITDHHIPELPGGKKLKIPSTWAQRLLSNGDALILMDGFDEVAESQRNHVSHWINAQMRCYPKSVFILTSRPGGYQSYIGKNNFKSTVFVQPFKKR